MKKSLLITATAGLFLIFLGLGLWTGTLVILEPTPEPVSLVSLDDPVPTQPEARRTSTLEPAGEMVLIVLTGGGEGNRTAEGVWLLSTEQEENRGNFLPVLPSQAEDGLVRDQILRVAFRLSEDGQPGPDFFRVLEERNLSWDGYLLVPEERLVELAGTPEGLNLIPDGTPDTLRYNPDTAEQSRSHQAQFLQTACEVLHQDQITPEARRVIEELLSQPGLAGTSAAGKVFVSPENGGGDLPECLFPTLNGTSR